ncbi:glycosyltransferase family 4 protein [Pseudoalteromonas sp. MIP2626]|uniref:hypothetical protein n=1 Tax=Pseudoalteromonas sp. MIP2626 TaxID=2705464 RepID=UPI0015C70692|nr:hypothetical protein [Pseudoalteromonas sp. MIP2626]NYR12051.1 glycosyltransferase family 4 protein [Pseudoalteromonas sp. MIP2626]
MKNIAIVTYNFLPYAASFGGVSRVTYLTKFLKERSYDVKIISTKGIFYSYFGNEWLQNEDVDYIGSTIHRKKQKNFNKGSQQTLFSHKIKGALKYLNKEVLIPDYGVLDVLKYIKKVNEYILSCKGDCTIILSAPPHSVNVLCLYIKRFHPKVKVILEYRDSWNTQPIFSKKNILANKISSHLEKLIINKADHFVYVSPVVLDMVENKFNISIKEKSKLIMNGYVASENVKETTCAYDKSKKLNLRGGYFGVINDFSDSYRSIYYLELLLSNSRSSIDLFGHVEFEKFDIDNSDNISYQGSLKHSEVYSIAQSYDYLVILHTEESSSLEPIPGKLFDYLYARKPIVCVMPLNSQVAKFILEHGIGIVVEPENVEGFNLNEALANFSFNNKLDITVYSREKQFENYLSIIND